MSIEKLVSFIQAHGPCTLTHAMEECKMGNYSKTLDQLAHYVRRNGGVEYNVKSRKWQRIAHRTEPRYAPEPRELRGYDLYANARLRAGAMDYKSLPSRF